MKKLDGSDYRHGLSPAQLSQSTNEFIQACVRDKFVLQPGGNIGADLARNLAIKNHAPLGGAVVDKSELVKWLASALTISEAQATIIHDAYSQQMFYFFFSIVGVLNNKASDLIVSAKSTKSELFIDAAGVVNVRVIMSSCTVTDVDAGVRNNIQGEATALYQLIDGKFVYVDGACDNDLLHAMALSQNFSFKDLNQLNQNENFLIFERLQAEEEREVQANGLVDMTQELAVNPADSFRYEFDADVLKKSDNKIVSVDAFKKEDPKKDNLKKDAIRGSIFIEGKIDRLESVSQGLIPRYLDNKLGSKGQVICDYYSQYFQFPSHVILSSIEQAKLDGVVPEHFMLTEPSSSRGNFHCKDGKVFYTVSIGEIPLINMEYGDMSAGKLTGETEYTYEIKDDGYELIQFKTNNDLIRDAVLGHPLRPLTEYAGYESPPVDLTASPAESPAEEQGNLSRADRLRQFFGITAAVENFNKLKEGMAPPFVTPLKVLSVAKYIFSLGFIVEPLKNTYALVQKAWSDHLGGNTGSVASSFKAQPLKTVGLGLLWGGFSLGRFVARSIFSPKVAFTEAWKNGNRLLAVASLLTTAGAYFALFATGVGVMLALPQMPSVIGAAMSYVLNTLAPLTGGLASAVAAAVTATAAIALMTVYSITRLPKTLLNMSAKWKEKQKAAEEEAKKEENKDPNSSRRPSQSAENDDEKKSLLSKTETGSSSHIMASLPKIQEDLKKNGWVIANREYKDAENQKFVHASAGEKGSFRLYKDKITSTESVETTTAERVETLEAELKAFMTAYPDRLPSIQADRGLHVAWLQVLQKAGFEAKSVGDKIEVSKPKTGKSPAP